MTDKTRASIFYSWQSDLPNATNRGLIEGALEAALKILRLEDSLPVEPVIDRDVAGSPGAPAIASTIFAKIDQSAIFACDVSIVTGAQMVRPSPNPNVLIELGYAVKALSWDRIVMIQNTHFGGPEQLPFDLRGHRVLTYDAKPDQSDRAEPRRRLAGSLAVALKDTFEKLPQPQEPAPATAFDSALSAVEAEARDRKARLRAYMRSLAEQLESVAPDLSSGTWRHEELVTAIDQSADLVAGYLQIATRAAELHDDVSLAALFDGLEFVAARIDRPVVPTGMIYDGQFDFYRFLAHELLVDLIAAMLREDQIDRAGGMVCKGVVVPKNGVLARAPFAALSRPMPTLVARNQILNSRRLSIRADILRDRYSTGPLKDLLTSRASVMPISFSTYTQHCTARTPIWSGGRTLPSLLRRQGSY
jgi:hypothetical protein